MLRHRASAALLAGYSDKRSSENYSMTFSNVGLSNQAYPTLGLSKTYVRVSGNTCSARESFVNGLRGIDVEVELVGTTTCGKPYGCVPQDNCGLTYAAMEIEGVNAKGQGGYSEGMGLCDDGELMRPLWQQNKILPRVHCL